MADRALLQKMQSLRSEADQANDRADAAEAKVKELQLLLTAKEQEVSSLQHRLGISETDLEKAEGLLTKAKQLQDEGDASRTTSEALQRKVQLLEEELETADKNLKDTVEKCVSSLSENGFHEANHSLQVETGRRQGRAL